MYVISLQTSCPGTGKSNRQLAGKIRFGFGTVLLKNYFLKIEGGMHQDLVDSTLKT